MLALGTWNKPKPLWAIPVVGVSSYSGQGIEELLDRIVKHRDALASTGLGAERRRRVAGFRLEKTAETMLLERFASGARALEAPLANQLAERGTDPYSAARALIRETLRKEYADELA
jgi:LAO/AO transport system kinase